jgi:hypothetical protein
MGKLQIFVEKDYVILSLPSRGNNLSMSPDVAEKIAEAGLNAVAYCEAYMKSGGVGRVVEGKQMECSRPISWDGRVNVRFSEYSDRFPIHYKDAKILFEEIRAKVTEAKYKFTIVDRRRAITAPATPGDK